MRATPILAALALLAAGLAFVPAAQASQPCDPDQGNPCDPQPIPVPAPDCRKVPDRPPLLEVTPECRVVVYVDAVSCPFGEREVTTTYWHVTVTYRECTSGSPASASTMQPPIDCVMAPCGPQDPVPDEPCKASALQPVPTVTVYVFRDCTVQVDHKPYDCVWNCGWAVLVQGPPITVRTYGQTGGEESASADLPNPCGPTATCQPSECPELFVATYQFLAYMGPHAWVRVERDCTYEHHVDPILEPASAAAADLPDLPGPPTFPVCVTEPCDTVVCDHAYDAVGPVTYEFTSACGLVLTAGFQCEASHHETVAAGPLAVRREQCEPGNPPAPTG